MDTHEEIFAVAKALPDEDRAAYLDEACEDTAERDRVEALLRGAEEAGQFFAEFEERSEEEHLVEGPGTVIGRYKLLQKIAEGGFGVVFMAEQQEPMVRRVALKVIKAGMDTRQIIARFEAERQALALMDHPNIAKVLDAGATASGRPYFVMELVRGIPITRFCDEQKFDTRQRLGLFMEICAAVQHAHQKGIIHRDLKPSNILVGLDADRPIAKVIDFGIAKATQQRLTEKTLFTQFEQLIGTPLYISPEQAELSPIDIDTRSDIYSLGVILYELVTGVPPLDAERLSSAGLDEMRRLIREVDAPKPSTRFSTIGEEQLHTIAQARHTEARKLSVLIRGDLDWIVLKALEKDRTRRYDTVNGFAADIRNFLEDKPVTAAAPSRVYKVRKFLRRYRTGAAVAATMTILATAGIWFAIREGVERESRKSAQDAQRRAVQALAGKINALEERDQALEQQAKATQDAEQARQAETEAKRSALAHQYFRTIDLVYREWQDGNQPLAAELLERCPEEMRSWAWHYLGTQVYPVPCTTSKLTSKPVKTAVFDRESRKLYVSTETGETLIQGFEIDEFDVVVTPLEEAVPDDIAAKLRSDDSPDIISVSITHGNNKVTLTGHSDGTIRWGIPHQTLHRGHASAVTCMATNKSGNRLISASDDGSLVLWESGSSWQGKPYWKEARAIQRFRTAESPRAVGLIDNPNNARGGFIYTLGFKGTLSVWPISGTRKQNLHSFKIGTFAASISFSPDGRNLAVLTDSSLSCYTFPALRLLFTSDRGGYRLAYHPSRELIAIAGKKAGHVIDSRSGAEVHKLPTFRSWSLAFDAQGMLWVPKDNPKTGGIEVWSINATPARISTITSSPSAYSSVAVSACGRFVAGAQSTYEMSLPHKKGLHGSPEILIWDLKEERLLARLRGHETTIWRLAFSPNGKWLASGAGSYAQLGTGELKLWNLQTMHEEHSYPVEVESIYALAFTPDNSRLISGGGHRSVQSTAITIWDVTEGVEVLRLAGPSSMIQDLALSPDGVHLATAERDGTVRIWSAPTFQARRDPSAAEN